MIAEAAMMEVVVDDRGVTVRPAKAVVPTPPATPLSGVGDLQVGDYAKVDCSTSAQPLQMLCACRLLGSDPVWQHGRDYNELWLAAAAAARRDDTPDELRKRVSLADAINSRIQVSGTHGAYVALIHGGAELILAARAPSADERALALARSVPLDVRPVALDAFIFLVNEQNPVTNLTTEALRRIYSGRVADWKEVGGAPGKLQAFQRERNSGSQELMESLVMRELKPVSKPEMILAEGMGGPFNRVGHDALGLGYSVLYYERRMTTRTGTKLIAVDGAFPSAENVRSRRYPYVAEVYVVTRADLPPGSPAAVLRDWMLSPDGQGVVAESGYVPLP